jgi:transcriptional regulator with XRE-family HTH domain
MPKVEVHILLQFLQKTANIISAAPTIQEAHLEQLMIERARRGLSRRELAKRSGVNEHTISEAERGIRKPRATTVARLAEALGLEPEDLLGKGQAPSLPASDEKTNLEALRRHIGALTQELEEVNLRAVGALSQAQYRALNQLKLDLEAAIRRVHEIGKRQSNLRDNAMQ